MASEQTEERKSLLQRMLDLVERVGNRVPHPVLMKSIETFWTKVMPRFR